MINLPEPWLYFCICIAITLLSTWLMARQGNSFYTLDPLRRKFSMLEMEFPAKEKDFTELINGIYMLPDESKKIVRALKIQLLLDYFLFIPATYGAIFIMCMEISRILDNPISYLFIGLAWSQCLCFLLDYIENTFFWCIINRPEHLKDRENLFFKMIQVLELMKWGFALIAGIGGLSAIVFFWLSGHYRHSSLKFVLLFGIEIFAFLLLSMLSKRAEKK